MNTKKPYNINFIKHFKYKYGGTTNITKTAKLMDLTGLC